MATPLNTNDQLAPSTASGVVSINPGDTIGNNVQYYNSGGTNYTNSQYQAPAPGATQAISMDQLQPAQAVNVPTQTPTVNPLPGAAAGATQTAKTYQDYVKANTPDPTALDQQQQDLLNSYSNLASQDTGRGAAQLAAEQAAGIPQQQQDLAHINGQISQHVAEANQSTASYEQMIANLENPNNAQQQGIPMNAIIGQQAQVRKMQMADATLKAANLNVLQAYAQGLQGNLTAAQDSVNRAIDLKYQDIESQMAAKQAQLQAIQPLLNKQEKIQAAALQQKYQDEQQATADKKAQDLQIQSMALDAIKNGADAQTVQKIGQATSLEQATTIATQFADQKANAQTALSSGIKTPVTNEGGKFFDTKTGQVFATPQDFFKATGVSSFAEAYAKGLVTDINPSNFQKTGVASYDEWQLYKSTGGKLSYNDYQTMDANRKAVRNTTNINNMSPTGAYDLQVKQAPSQVANLKAQGKSWGDVVAYFNGLNIDPGSPEIDDALHRAYQSQADYEAWKVAQKAAGL